ncbi:MAG: hypothetical protein IKU21_04540 [Anaerotignum sp.]|nr:hypothetical protein [Anaerotignum sp.]
MEGFAYMLHPAWLGYIFPALAILTVLFALLFFDAFRKKDKRKQNVFGSLLVIFAVLLIGWCIRLYLWFSELTQMVPPHF